MNPAATASLDLRDIHAAVAPGIWPPAPGWWVLALLLIAVVVLSTLWLLRRYHLFRLKLQIMDEIESLSDCCTNNTEEFTARLSMLLRRVALRRYSRERVASLTGNDWLRFLDETGGDGDFEHGIGQVLEDGPYRPHTRNLPAEELLSLARRWVKQNLEVVA
ncbi:MAG: DUF4381 domain-containing protein [Pseudomonadota bacterium]